MKIHTCIPCTKDMCVVMEELRKRLNLLHVLSDLTNGKKRFPPKILVFWNGESWKGQITGNNLLIRTNMNYIHGEESCVIVESTIFEEVLNTLHNIIEDGIEHCDYLAMRNKALLKKDTVHNSISEVDIE